VENVELPLLVLRVKPSVARRKARELLDAVGLSQRERHRPAELSGGQRQRVTVARALVNDPAIVWADEPTGNLDSEAADEVMALLTELNQTRDQTFVIVTHAPDIAAHTHRTIRMRDGRIVQP
jgi:putative ABC transport system ATP-binding protein